MHEQKNQNNVQKRSITFKKTTCECPRYDMYLVCT
jgi:hypothetical protein